MKSRAMDSLGFSTWRPCKQLFAAIGTRGSTYFSTIERSGIQLRSGESDLLQRQYGGPVNVRIHRTTSRTLHWVCRTRTRFARTGLANRRYTQVGPPASYWATRRDRLTGRASNFVGRRLANDLAPASMANFSVSTRLAPLLMMTTGSSSSAKTRQLAMAPTSHSSARAASARTSSTLETRKMSVDPA